MPAAAEPVVRVRVDPEPAVTEVGLNDAPAPLGSPPTDIATLWAEPDVTAVEMVLVTEVPCTALRLLGLAEIEKSLAAGAVMVTVTVVECVALAPVAVIVRV